MAFPAIEGTPAETAVSTASTTHAINLPASIVAGELLLIITAKGTPAQSTTFNALAGWTEVIDEAVSLGMTIWAREADATEGATVTMTSAAAVRSASIAYRISGAEDPATQLPELRQFEEQVRPSRVRGGPARRSVARNRRACRYRAGRVRPARPSRDAPRCGGRP